MVLVDTSVWIRHLRSVDQALQELLISGSVLVHPFIIGELACGSLANRRQVVELLKELPAAISAEENEVLQLVDEQHLWGSGIGWIDAHLVASALLSDCELWSLDGKLSAAAGRSGVRII